MWGTAKVKGRDFSCIPSSSWPGASIRAWLPPIEPQTQIMFLKNQKQHIFFLCCSTSRPTHSTRLTPHNLSPCNSASYFLHLAFYVTLCISLCIFPPSQWQGLAFVHQPMTMTEVFVGELLFRVLDACMDPAIPSCIYQSTHWEIQSDKLYMITPHTIIYTLHHHTSTYPRKSLRPYTHAWILKQYACVFAYARTYELRSKWLKITAILQKHFCQRRARNTVKR